MVSLCVSSVFDRAGLTSNSENDVERLERELDECKSQIAERNARIKFLTRCIATYREREQVLSEAVDIRDNRIEELKNVMYRMLNLPEDSEADTPFDTSDLPAFPVYPKSQGKSKD